MTVHIAIAKLLERAQTSTYPHLNIQVRVSPQTDLSVGDYWTDMGFEIARQERVLPTDCADRILGALKVDDRLEFSQSRGFINVRVVDARLWGKAGAASVIDSGALKNHKIIVVGRGSAIGIDFTRLMARALMQRQIIQKMGGQVDVATVERGRVIKTWDRGYAQEVIERSCSLYRDTTESIEDVTADLEPLIGGFAGVLHLWVMPVLMESRGFVSNFGRWRETLEALSVKSITGDSHGTVSIRELERCLTFDREALWNLLLNLGGPEETHEIDLESARLPERANLRWYTQRTLERLKRVTFFQCSWGTWAHLIIQRLSSWELFVKEAAYLGKVGELFVCMRSFLDAVNAVLNDPATYGQTRSDQSSGAGITFSSVHDRLSSMLEMIY